MHHVTVKDIARELNISQGTVSKALGSKKGVSKEMRKLVTEASQRLGYIANSSAQALARNPVKIGIVMPDIWQKFYGYFGYQKCGIELELMSLKNQRFYGYFTYVPGDFPKNEYKDVLASFARDRMDAVIICPALPCDYSENLDPLFDNGINTVILGNAPIKGKRLAEIRMASEIAGSLAAEHASLLCKTEKSSAVFIGNKDSEDHRKKAECFQHVAEESHMPFRGVFETQDDIDIAYRLTSILAKENDLGLIYVATGNSATVCRCLQDLHMTDRIKVIATDIFPEMYPYVNEGIVSATIYQDPIRMGRMAVRTIFNAISMSEPIEPEILIYPQLILKSNYHVIANYLEQTVKNLTCNA